MASLPLTLAARLLPTAVIAVAGWSLATAPDRESGDDKPAAVPSPSAARQTAVYAKPPAPCSAVTAATVKDLVPGAKAAGERLDLSDPGRRTGCAWNALKGFDYRWLDVTYEVSAAGQNGAAEEVASAVYARTKQGEAVAGLGDEASVGDELTKEAGQQVRQAVAVVRKDNAVITVTYNGSDFETKKAPDADEVRESALRAATDALNALGAK